MPSGLKLAGSLADSCLEVGEGSFATKPGVQDEDDLRAVFSKGLSSQMLLLKAPVRNHHCSVARFAFHQFRRLATPKPRKIMQALAPLALLPLASCRDLGAPLASLE